MLLHIEFHLEDGRTHSVPWSSGEPEAIAHATTAIHDGQALSAILRDDMEVEIWRSTASE